MVLSEADARRALEQDEFFPVFQPVVELRTGQLAGFEALARWNHPQLGLIPPDEFISILERHLLIDSLTQSILQQAFASPVLKDSALTLAVNISPIQLLGSNIAERIADVAAHAGFALDRLIIEITESALLDDLPQAQAAARDLKSLRCKLSLDDFGTGYSSLRHLHAFPFDELKVDRSFVSTMIENRSSRKTVAAVVGLGQSLGLTTVAEGVETQAQADMLLWLGCDQGQGWLYGKPVPAVELPRLIAEMRCQPAAISVSFEEHSIVSRDILPAQRLAQLQAIYDGAPVGLCLLDRNFRYVSLNRRLSQMNGVPAAAHLGKTVAEIIPHMFPTVEPYIRRALHGESISCVEIQKLRLDAGEDQALMASYQPVLDEAGEVLGVSVAVMDITEQRRTEAALRESEEHYRHMMQLNPHIPWVLNTQGEIIEASPRWEQITGQPIEQALGNGWLQMVHPEDISYTQEAIRNALGTGQPIDIEYRIRRADGEWIWMRSRGAPRLGPSGKIVCIYGVVEEVHGHKQASEELQHGLDALRATVNAVADGIVLIDAQDCTVRIVNPVAQKIFGNAVTPGMTLTEYTRLPMTHPDGRRLRPEEFPLVRAILRGECVGDIQLIYERSGGFRLWICVSARPIHDKDGQLIGGLAMIQNRRCETAGYSVDLDSPVVAPQ